MRYYLQRWRHGKQGIISATIENFQGQRWRLANKGIISKIVGQWWLHILWGIISTDDGMENKVWFLEMILDIVSRHLWPREDTTLAEMIPHDIRSYLWPNILEMIPCFPSLHLWRWYLENRSVISGDDTLKSKPSSLEMIPWKASLHLRRWLPLNTSR